MDINNNIGAFVYSPEQQSLIDSIAEEASSGFPVGAIYPSAKNLREQLRAFAHKKGFALTSDGSSLLCTKCDEPQGQKNKRDKKTPVPIEKKRKQRENTRCSCPFKVTYASANWKEKRTDPRVKITKSSCYRHDNGCQPSRGQLSMEVRKSGCYTTAIHESQIKTILTLMTTGKKKIDAATLRGLIRPLYPEGTSLDATMIFNFRLKVKRMLNKGIVDISSYTVTHQQEQELVSPDSLETRQSPEFLTEVFTQFTELLKHSLLDLNDLDQMFSCLDSLVEADPSFAYRVSRSLDGTVTAFIWQTGVMRKDFELYGDALFVDRLGRPLNNKGWPSFTVAMLDGMKKLCLAAESFGVMESVDAYAWIITSIVDMAPNRQLSDIKIVFADGILAGESLLRKLGNEATCHIVLDHHHLLDEKIGSFPKEFGLNQYPTVKNDLTVMVKSHSEAVYNAALERLRATVRDNNRFADYVENHVHGKRHLFANHLIKKYTANLHRQGNVPAECNHA